MSCECKSKKGHVNQWTTHADEYQKLLGRMTGIAEKNRYILNTDTERLEKVLGLMTENLVDTGKAYCPCKQSDPPNLKTDVLCPCPDWKKEIAKDGNCYCRLFFSKTKSDVN
jgi:ferredoxin-thioredoxin reductase catalytic chain